MWCIGEGESRITVTSFDRFVDRTSTRTSAVITDDRSICRWVDWLLADWLTLEMIHIYQDVASPTATSCVVIVGPWSVHALGIKKVRSVKIIKSLQKWCLDEICKSGQDDINWMWLWELEFYQIYIHVPEDYNWLIADPNCISSFIRLQTKAHLDVLADALLRWARGR